LAANGVEAEREKQTKGNRKHAGSERVGPSELGDGGLQIENSAFVLDYYIVNRHVT
jgi:hypothetical protein